MGIQKCEVVVRLLACGITTMQQMNIGRCMGEQHMNVCICFLNMLLRFMEKYTFAEPYKKWCWTILYDS